MLEQFLEFLDQVSVIYFCPNIARHFHVISNLHYIELLGRLLVEIKQKIFAFLLSWMIKLCCHTERKSLNFEENWRKNNCLWASCNKTCGYFFCTYMFWLCWKKDGGTLDQVHKAQHFQNFFTKPFIYQPLKNIFLCCCYFNYTPLLVFTRNLAETDRRLWLFGIENKIFNFFQIFH